MKISAPISPLCSDKLFPILGMVLIISYSPSDKENAKVKDSMRFHVHMHLVIIGIVYDKTVGAYCGSLRHSALDLITLLPVSIVPYINPS